MATVKDSAFENVAVRLDGTEYQGCSFRRCTLVYSGGLLPGFSDCTFEACGWHFEEAAGRTVMFIRAFAQAMGPEGRAFVENLFFNPPSSSPTSE